MAMPTFFLPAFPPAAAPVPAKSKKPMWGYNEAGTGPFLPVAPAAKKEAPKPSGLPKIFYMPAPNPNAPPPAPAATAAPAAAARPNIFYMKAAPPAPPVAMQLPFTIPPPPPGTNAPEGPVWVAVPSPNGVVSCPRRRKKEESSVCCGCLVS